MHTGIQTLLLREQNINVTLYKTYLDRLDKFIFSKKRIESPFSANNWGAICRICKNAAFWLAEKILLFDFVRINKVFARHLPTEN